MSRHTILLKHTTPKNMATADRTSGMAIQALHISQRTMSMPPSIRNDRIQNPKSVESRETSLELSFVAACLWPPTPPDTRRASLEADRRGGASRCRVYVFPVFRCRKNIRRGAFAA